MSRVGIQQTRAKPRTFLSRLLHEKTGNVMYIMAAATIPIVGMIGGAVDLSRAYLVKARMQQACDAGALTGRRSMAGNAITEDDKTAAYKVFFYNFPNETMGTVKLIQNKADVPNFVNATKTSDNQFGMVASTRMPTTLLKIIGRSDIPITVSCTGEEFFVNTDVMLVLDTTKSMNCTIEESCGSPPATEKTNSRMSQMRTAVKQLYSDLIPAQEALKEKNLRMRFGFVMFALNVNVGKLIRAENTSYFRAESGTVGSNRWSGRPLYYNLSNKLAAPTVTHDTNWFNNVWSGCIEERGTNATITSSSVTRTADIPSDAYDLNIDLIPTTDNATKWGPHDPVSETKAGTNTLNFACPRASRHLEVWDYKKPEVFNAYVDTIKNGDGYTYHDIGMIWGARMISPTGIFGYRNPTIFNDVKVARTIVFLTDGDQVVASSAYNAYGIEANDKRVASDGKNLAARHSWRFMLMCKKAKEQGADIWVIGLALDVDDIADCANSGQAVTVKNAQQLSDAFKRISDKVGNLRIGA